MKRQRILRLQSRRATERIVIPACRPATRSVVRLRRISFFRSLFNQREKFDPPDIKTLVDKIFERFPWYSEPVRP
jgi:hypothetical protein